MSRSGIVAAALVAAALVAGCGGKTPEESMIGDKTVAAPAVPPLSAEEVRVYLADSTLRQIGENRYWLIYYGSEGRLEGFSKSATGTTERVRGTWEVTPEGLLCRRWQRDWSGAIDGCSQVYRLGGSYVMVPEGGDPKAESALRFERKAGDLVRKAR